MAKREDSLAENAPGDWFVDSSCIDCDMCRALAPSTYERSDRAEQSFVARQPLSPDERRRAALALVACPTSSIGTSDKRDVRWASSAFPIPIDDRGVVYFCGYASEDSFGASSYLIRRSGGNVLIDSPRAVKALMDNIEALGGVSTMVLTHRDDVADHEAFHRRFGCARVIHEADKAALGGPAEQIIQGRDPAWIAEDLLVIPVPGHTRGSMALLHDGHLFSGDHLWYEEGEGLYASRGVCWYSWAEQTRSMERLLELDFTWVLPGHGRRWQAPNGEAMRVELGRLVTWMKARSAR